MRAIGMSFSSSSSTDDGQFLGDLQLWVTRQVSDIINNKSCCLGWGPSKDHHEADFAAKKSSQFYRSWKSQGSSFIAIDVCCQKTSSAEEAKKTRPVAVVEIETFLGAVDKHDRKKRKTRMFYVHLAGRCGCVAAAVNNRQLIGRVWLSILRSY